VPGLPVFSSSSECTQHCAIGPRRFDSRSTPQPNLSAIRSYPLRRADSRVDHTMTLVSIRL
jgi:hypothetical protein